MNWNRTFKRRKFLKQIIFVCSSVPLLSSCDFFLMTSIEEIATQLTMLLRYPASAGWLGKIYLATHQELDSLDIEELSDKILAKIGLKIKEISDSDLQNFHKLLANQIRKDFPNGNVVTVDGWLLSKTEADLCALVFKLQKT